MPAGRTLTVDIGVVSMGWACGGPGGKPAYGLIKLPGTSDLRKLMLAARNEVDDLIVRHDPDAIRFVPVMAWGNPLNIATEEGMRGIQGVLYLLAGDHEIAVLRADERQVRKAVLGKCDFGRKDAKTGRLVANAGREEAKALVLAWCADQGYDLRGLSHDTGDSIVLWQWDQMQRHGRTATRSALTLSGSPKGRTQ